jgi:hypothetical protein
MFSFISGHFQNLTAAPREMSATWDDGRAPPLPAAVDRRGRRALVRWESNPRHSAWEAEDFKGGVPRYVQPAKLKKIEVEYMVNKDTWMLKSTAKDIVDDFSLTKRGNRGTDGTIPKVGSPTKTSGGAVQYFFNHYIDTNNSIR